MTPDQKEQLNYLNELMDSVWENSLMLRIEE